MSHTYTNVRIGDWGEVKGGRQRSFKIKTGTNRPYLRVANVFDGYIDMDDVLEMPFRDDEFEAYSLRPGDILLNEGQSLELVGRSAIYHGPPDKLAFQNTLVRFRAGRNCVHGFAQELFRNLRRKGIFEAIAKQTTSIAHLGVTRFADLVVRVPPLPVQRHIATIAKRYNATDHALRCLIAAKRELKRGLMHQLLTGLRRFSDFGAPADDDGEVPAGWIRRPLADLGRIVSGGTPSTRVPEYWNGGIPWCTPTDITALRTPFIDNTAREISRAGIQASSARILPPGSVIVCTRATIGDAAINRVPMATNQGFKSIIPHDSGNPDLLYYVILHNRKALVQRGAGSTFLEVSSKMFSSLNVIVPEDSEEQERIVCTLHSMGREVLLLERIRQSLGLQKCGLMQKLLSGEVEVSVPAAAHAENDNA